MKELIPPQSAEKWLLFIAVAGPLAGLILGTLIGAHERCAARKMVAGALIGGIGSLVYGLWILYNMITDALGLDSVANLCLQLGMFAVLGAAVGVGAYRISAVLRKLGARD
jgi:hypothetical protein